MVREEEVASTESGRGGKGKKGNKPENGK